MSEAVFKGSIAEAKVLIYLLKLKLRIYRPVVDTGVDFIVECEKGHLNKVQVKLAHKETDRETYRVNLLGKYAQIVDLLAVVYDDYIGWLLAEELPDVRRNIDISEEYMVMSVFVCKYCS